MASHQPTIPQAAESSHGSAGAPPIHWLAPHDRGIESAGEPLLSALCRQGPGHFGSNLGGRLRLLDAFGTTIPVLVVNEGGELSDVCSPITRYVGYPLEEARRGTGAWRGRLLAAVAGGWGAGLARLGIERVVYVNNWLLATNPPLRLSPARIQALTRWLAGEYTDHAIVFRTVNPMLEPGMTASLVEAGCRLVTTRVVYVIDPRRSSFLRHRNVRDDRRLLRTTPYRLSEDKTSVSADDLSRIQDQYDKLYIGKYCRHNAQFRATFFAQLLATPMIRATLLRDPESGRLDAFSLYMDNGPYLTACLIGYDLALPRRLGLYRMVMMHEVLLAERRGQLVNLSGGAGDFKRLRGAEPVREYDAVFDRHLPRHRRLPWRLVGLEGRLFGRG